jgi:hypothetical protein
MRRNRCAFRPTLASVNKLLFSLDSITLLSNLFAAAFILKNLGTTKVIKPPAQIFRQSLPDYASKAQHNL